MTGASHELKGRLGSLVYFVSGMRALRGPRASITLAVDGRIEPPRRVRTVVVGNCGKLLAGLVLMPARRMFWMNRVPGADYSCAAELFETAHRSQSGPQPSVIGSIRLFAYRSVMWQASGTSSGRSQANGLLQAAGQGCRAVRPNEADQSRVVRLRTSASPSGPTARRGSWPGPSLQKAHRANPSRVFAS
jgi:hypothetical protein